MKPPAIAFKDLNDLFWLWDMGHSLHLKLEEVLRWVSEYWTEKFEMTPVVTSLWREPMPGESGIHSTNPLRATDIRLSGLNEAQMGQFESDCNQAWIYDPQRPQMRVCRRHDVGQGDHFHLQVHERTDRATSHWRSRDGV